MAADGCHGRRSSRSRSSAATRPRTWSSGRASSTRQWAELERFARGDRRPADGVRARRRGRCTRACATTARRSSPAARSSASSPKEKLPTYNVFYEGRTFARGCRRARRRCTAACPSAISSSASTSACSRAEVCEDIWSPDGPMRRRSYCRRRAGGATSPPRRSASASSQTRREMIATRAADNQCTLAYANLVGANDGLIFDGGGFVNQNGKSMLRGAALPRGLRRRDRRSRPHRCGCARENTTWRDDREDCLRRDARRCRRSTCRAELPHRDRASS